MKARSLSRRKACLSGSALVVFSRHSDLKILYLAEPIEFGYSISMADGSQDDSQKTEEPTQKKLEEAKKRGQTYNSREINSFLILFTFALLLGWASDSIFGGAVANMAQFIQRPDTISADMGGLGDVLHTTIINVATTMVVPMLAFVVAALFASTVQKPLILSTDPITPKLEKISPMKGLKRMFSLRSIMEFVKGLVKISIVGFVGFLAIWPDRGQLLRLPNTSIEGLMAFLHGTLLNMLIGVLVALFFIAMLDYFYQRFEFFKNLRMSKQEIKDEYKQQEGDPLVKQKLRQIRMERSRKRMIAEVPTADVVITNPTHYSVALKYDNQTMQAPVMVAKGKDKVAFKIRKIAKEEDIPIVEDPPLARALFAGKLDEEIPLEHYKAVAEVISYVYKLKGKKVEPRVHL